MSRSALWSPPKKSNDGSSKLVRFSSRFSQYPSFLFRTLGGQIHKVSPIPKHDYSKLCLTWRDLYVECLACTLAVDRSVPFPKQSVTRDSNI